MATKIKLKRLGKMRQPQYRIVVADARTKRDGRVIEEIGKYHPKEHPSFIEVDAERAAYWLSVGAQATDPVRAILRVTGDWQKFAGEPAPPPMLVAEPKADKKAVFEAAHAANQEAEAAATTPKKKSAPKADEPKVDAKAEEPKAHAKPEEPKPEEPKAEEPKTEEPKTEEPKTDKPEAEEAKADELKVDEPKVDEAAAEASTGDEA